ncbi:MAG: hypothetical protein OXC29_12880, partial [Rhodococcus sp.]|nr:hypothetical protein [Rhodococcus sp. (in: high G+C Gram-positive bacteria)]
QLTYVDGEWQAAFVPNTMTVELGASGESVEITQVEAGGYMLPDGTPIVADTTTDATNGATYGFTTGEDGTVTASYVDDPVTVTLGTEGGTIKLYRQEDQATWHRDGAVFMSGEKVMVMVDDRTNTYTVTMDAETGMWSAMYDMHMVSVDLGMSGTTVKLTRDEMGGWWTDPDTAFSSGEIYTLMTEDAENMYNGNEYKLTFGEDGWMAMYVPDTKMITGTDLTASANEDGSGYTIVGLDGQVLDADGMGSVMSPDGNFRVHMNEDGMLVGVQYEMAVNTRNAAAQKAGATIGTDGVFATNAYVVNRDDTETEGINEAGTMITINGDNYPIGELFMAGESSVDGEFIITGKGGVLEKITTLAAQIEGLRAVNAQENPKNDSLTAQTDFSNQFREKWKAIDTALDEVFGDLDGDTDADTTYDHITALSEDRLSLVQLKNMEDTLDKIVAALSSEDGFLAAAADDGIFDGSTAGNNANAVAKNATATFNAIRSTATVYMARTENTRFGVFSKESTDTADMKLASDSMGAYAYSPMKATKFADLPQAGAAEYNGRTMAISTDGKMVYNGDISLQVRFRGKRVSGLVENLLDGDGNLFEYGFGKVAAILLGEATITADGDFTKDFERPSQIIFAAEPGQPRAETLSDDEGADGTAGTDDDVIASTFAGQFVGGGAAAIGTWGISASTDEAENLTAAFGAEKGDDVPETPPTVSGGGVAMTRISGSGVSAVNAKTGVITLVARVAGPPVVPAVTVKGADLFETGGVVMSGDTFVATAIKK